MKSLQGLILRNGGSRKLTLRLDVCNEAPNWIGYYQISNSATWHAHGKSSLKSNEYSAEIAYTHSQQLYQTPHPASARKYFCGAQQNVGPNPRIRGFPPRRCGAPHMSESGWWGNISARAFPHQSIFREYALLRVRYAGSASTSVRAGPYRRFYPKCKHVLRAGRMRGLLELLTSQVPELHPSDLAGNHPSRKT